LGKHVDYRKNLYGRLIELSRLLYSPKDSPDVEGTEVESLSTKKNSLIDNSADQPTTIKFYRANERPYGVFSNLFPCQVDFEGKTYPTAEHAYQAGKALKPKVRDWILAAPSPALAAMAAHGLYVWDVVPNWQSIKYDRMRAVLRAKFLQHPKLSVLLLSTGSARLVEAGRVNNAVNRLWGEVDGVGQNMLGVMLMELRAELAGNGTPTKYTVSSATKPKRSVTKKRPVKKKKTTKSSQAARPRGA
jgi:ribA/ribD-fused uncharacterized protein